MKIEEVTVIRIGWQLKIEEVAVTRFVGNPLPRIEEVMVTRVDGD